MQLQNIEMKAEKCESERYFVWFDRKITILCTVVPLVLSGVELILIASHFIEGSPLSTNLHWHLQSHTFLF